MTPYELRFEIFKQASSMVMDEYYSKVTELNNLVERNPEVSVEYPPFPSYSNIEQVAYKINSFVNDKTQN